MNMGSWMHVSARFIQLLKRNILYSGRGVSGSVATGIGTVHR